MACGTPVAVINIWGASEIITGIMGTGIMGTPYLINNSIIDYVGLNRHT